jgi:(2R)-sulfolactate sulfo-lyase subunit alpha
MFHFVVHDENDSVGVVVVEGVKAGQKMNGWIMDQDKSIDVTAKSDIPIGHKVAIRALDNGATVIKYGVDIGKTISAIQVGDHTHVHNVRTKRW